MAFNHYRIGDDGGWKFNKFSNSNSCIPLNFSKVLPLDDNYSYVVGGSTSTDFSAPTNPKEPAFSLFLVDMRKGEIIYRRKMNNYRQHSACAVYKKKWVYVIGGELNGQWLDDSFKFDLTLPKHDEIRGIAKLPATLFGPAMTFADKSPGDLPVIYVAGLNTITKVT